jgi:hypothetical protein
MTHVIFNQSIFKNKKLRLLHPMKLGVTDIYHVYMKIKKKEKIYQ